MHSETIIFNTMCCHCSDRFLLFLL